MSVIEIEIGDCVAVDALCDEEYLHVELGDGRIVSIPISWSPSLMAASSTERNSMEFMPTSIVWPDIGEEIAVTSLLQGKPMFTALSPGTFPASDTVTSLKGMVR
ncbi:MAG: DUF2442 domain-containing protein [Allorhizobium sp.]